MIMENINDTYNLNGRQLSPVLSFFIVDFEAVNLTFPWKIMEQSTETCKITAK